MTNSVGSAVHANAMSLESQKRQKEGDSGRLARFPWEALAACWLAPAGGAKSQQVQTELAVTAWRLLQSHGFDWKR
jgi:hypothetical protein